MLFRSVERERGVVGVAAQDVGQPEIGDAKLAVVAGEDVARLEVAVRDAGRMGVREATRDREADRGDLGPRQRRVLRASHERAAAAVLLDEERRGQRVVEVEHLHDVRVAELRERRGFAAEAPTRVLVGRDPRVMIRYGFAANAVAMLGFALSRSAVPAFITGFFLGVSYFFTTTAMSTVLQGRLAPHERGRTMALWFMSFGGTVPIGNMIFGPLVDRYGARWLLLLGAAWALVLAWWCDTQIGRAHV